MALEPLRRQPRAVAEDDALPFHEAAHAVAAIVQGLDVQAVTIEPGVTEDGRRYKGMTRVGGLRLDDPEDVRRVLVCVLAEEAATERLIRSPSDRVRTVVARRGDERMISGGLAVLGLEPEAADTLLAELRAKAVEIVETRWEAVEAIADALRERLTLDGEQVRAIFEGADASEG